MSKFIIGSDRSQIPLFASSMDQAIAQDNQVRLIDLFVDSLKLADFGFDFTFVENGIACPVCRENRLNAYKSYEVFVTNIFTHICHSVGVY